MPTRDELRERIEQLIRKLADGSTAHSERDSLIDDLSDWQATQIPSYRRLHNQSDASPALPTNVFRFARVAAHEASLDVRSFLSSGTTQTDRSRHSMRDLFLYDLAAQTAARYALFPDRERMKLLVLAPDETQAPHSSLSYMLSRFEEWFGTETTWVWQDDKLDIEALGSTLKNAEDNNECVAILGTSFAFVHAEDALDNLLFSLPPRSRIMQTGGFKGRSRSVEATELRQQLSKRYGIPEALIVSEYGMTELSSQLYENTLRNALIEGQSAERSLWVPGWVKATPVDPDTLLPVAIGEKGVLRIDDCANLDSVACIQTADLARRVNEGIVVMGRSAQAVPRGCSLAADIALGTNA